MRFSSVLALLLWATTASAQVLWPNVTYDPAIPTLKSVVGHDHGEAISTPEQIGRYLEALDKAAPDRTRLVHYATSWEGRPLHYLVVGSAERIAKLDAVQTRHAGAGRGRPGRRSPGRRPAGRGAADPRRPRQRDLVVGRRACRGLPPARRAEQRRRRRHAARRARASSTRCRTPTDGSASSPEPARTRASSPIRIRSRPNTTSPGRAVASTTISST